MTGILGQQSGHPPPAISTDNVDNLGRQSRPAILANILGNHDRPSRPPNSVTSAIWANLASNLGWPSRLATSAGITGWQSRLAISGATWPATESIWVISVDKHGNLWADNLDGQSGPTISTGNLGRQSRRAIWADSLDGQSGPAI